MSKTSHLHKKALFFSVALSAPFLCATLYGSGMPQEMDLELTSKKRPAQDTPGGHINKKPKLDMSGNDLSLALAQPTAVSFDAVPQDVTSYLSFFLNLQDKNHFALVSKATYKAARDALIHTDIRGLKDKEWANGPTKSTFENYLFNSVLWKMGSILLHKANNQNKISLFEMGPLLAGYAYLQNQCGHLKASQNVLEAFFNMENFRASENGALMAGRALSHPKGGEDDFLSLVHSLSPNGETYTLPQDVSTPMGLVERFQRTASAYRDLMNQNLTWQTRASQGDFLLTYDMMPITLETIEYTANAHYNNAGASKAPSQKLASFTRAAELLDRALDQRGTDATARDIKNTAAVHYKTGGLSEDPSQKLAHLNRAADLFDAMLEKMDAGAQIHDIKCAANVHYVVGVLSKDPSQKLASFIRAAQLYEAMLNKLGAGAQVPDITYAANAYFKVGEASNEPSQKLISFTRAAKLYDAALAQLGAGAQVPDIKRTAAAHYNVGEASNEPSQKLASFTRAAELSDTVIDRLGAGAHLNDITYAANVHYNVGRVSFEPSKELAHLKRAATLLDRVFALNPDQPITYLEASVTVYDFIGDPDKANEIRTRIASLPASQKSS
jgi:hypothetical protein